jgi:hypothetical protein
VYERLAAYQELLSSMELVKGKKGFVVEWQRVGCPSVPTSETTILKNITNVIAIGDYPTIATINLLSAVVYLNGDHANFLDTKGNSPT